MRRLNAYGSGYREFLQVGDRAELVRPRDPERVVAAVEVEAANLLEGDGRVGDGPRLPREHRHLVSEFGQLTSDVPAVDALPPAVRIAAVDEKGDPERITRAWQGGGARARQGGGGSGHEGPRMEEGTVRGKPSGRPSALRANAVSSRSVAFAPVITPAMVARSGSVADVRWSPTGSRLAWIVAHDGRADLVVAPADASGPPVIVTADTGIGGGYAWIDDDELVVAARS